MPGRRDRPASLEYAVFGLAALLASFIAWQAVKRLGAAAAPPPPPGAAVWRVPDPSEIPEAAPRARPSPAPETAGRGALPPVKVDRVERRRRPAPAPVVPRP